MGKASDAYNVQTAFEGTIMRIPTYASAYQVLLLQAADEGRGPILFGESLDRAREEVPPFLVGERFPDVYLEHPLIGEPFVDVTVLLGEVEPGTRVASPLAGEHGAMLDWYAETRREQDGITCGFEIDTKQAEPPVAAVHFQPRMHRECVRPFCDAIGEPERAPLYLGLDRRMPSGWPLSFFGLFRGRAAAPLRVCGYLGRAEIHACAKDPLKVAQAFDAIGFAAYDSVMLTQVSALMAAAPGTVDFQFDVYPDGSLGSTFAIDVRFDIQQPQIVRASFESGPCARVMGLLEGWGVADERWRLGGQAAFARAVPVELADGTLGRYAFTLMPQWVKARWTDCEMQPSKLYHLASAKLVDESATQPRVL